MVVSSKKQSTPPCLAEAETANLSSIEILQNPSAGPAREKISAFIIAFNEERHIGDCIASLKFCDEILVIDSFSSDSTVAIAEEMGARVISRRWPGYREQKAFGLSEVKYDWVINIDADERVDSLLRGEIVQVLEGRDLERTGAPIVGYSLNRVVFHLGRWWRSGGWYPEYRLRLFRKDAVIWGGQDPHEKPITSGRIEKLKGELSHYSYSGLEDQFKRLLKFASLSAEESFQLGKKASVFDIVIRPFSRSVKFFIVKRGYREGVAGLIVAIAEGIYTFMKYARLWELNFNASEKADENE